MKKPARTAVYDAGLRLEAYRLEGVLQPFPSHFHTYYVIGLVEAGQRRLCCNNQEYELRQGDVLLLNPGDSHACVQTGTGTLDYRGFNISREVMRGFSAEITGRQDCPGFARPVIRDGEIACLLRSLHALLLGGSADFAREEALLLSLSLLLERYGRPFEACVSESRAEIERACAFMEQHYAEHIGLEQICRCANLGKSALLRAFTRAKGMTPYRYLEAVRIGAARRLLEQGAAPAEAALRTGFSDQSHFTNYFSRLIGLPPGAYREIFLRQTRAAEESTEINQKPGKGDSAP